MNLVAIETAAGPCSVALLIDGDVVVELTLNRPRAHAENLVPLLADALRYGGLEAGDLDAVAVSAGPGSFTGLRIGASTAKGLAVAVDADLVDVPSLEALAFPARDMLAESDILLAAFDARRDDVFASAFRREPDGSLGVRMETVAISAGELARRLGTVEGAVWLVGDGGAKIARAWPDGAAPATLLPEADVHPAAASVARLGAARLSRGETADPSHFEPFYLKDFVAKTPAASAFERLPF